MGKKKVGFAGQQIVHRDFFDSEQDIAIGHILPDLNARQVVFLIGIAAVGRRLDNDPDLRRHFVYPFTLGGRQRHAVVCRYFAFAQ